MKALEKERSRRYGSASELAEDVGRYLRSEPVGARRAGAAYRLSKYVRRNRTAAALAALAFVASIGFSLVIARQLRDTRASLAAALIGRAQAAERDLDWGLAAAYYAASRVQRDSPASTLGNRAQPSPHAAHVPACAR